MRTLLIPMLLAAASVAFAQAEKGKAAAEQKPQAVEQDAKDPELEERARVEGAAGGTRPVPEDKRKSVGAGAGPHRHDHLPSPAKLPRDEPVAPPK
jgi:hypothetical protein